MGSARSRRLLGTLLVAALSAAGGVGVAHGAVLSPCANGARSLCGRVVVPLDRGGVLPGTISLRVKTLPARGGAAPGGTVLALAGGPGQAAVPLLDAFAAVLRPVLRTRQLVTFDQRGTGGSGRLRCSALSKRGSLASVVGRCAAELGTRRTTYTTATSVADVESVRAALGADKLILYAASYGTKVAVAYAAAFPQHVERLVLDSIVPADGIDPFQRSTLASIPRVLRSVCASDCRFTHNPGADVAALARRLARDTMRGAVVDGRGRAHRARLSEGELLGLLLDGDFDRYLRAALPAAVRGALAGDAAPLLRLAAQAGGAGSLSAGSDSDAVYVATTCQDGAVPWASGTPLAARRAAVGAAATAIPDRDFAPFDRATVRALGTADLCRGWPESPIAQPLPPLPATPTLILSGDDDLRTPRLDAEALAGQLPDAHLLEVPDAGHGVLFSDPSDCAERAVDAFVRGLVPGDCRRHPSVAQAAPLAPWRLVRVHAARGVPGLAGRTVTAVLLTLDDASRQLLEQALASARPRPFGGLRAGSAVFDLRRGLRLRRYAYVPGVAVSGLVPLEGSRFTLTVGGRAAAHGQLTFSRRHGIVGVLDGEPVHVGSRALGGSSAVAAAAAATASSALAEPAPVADGWVRRARAGR